jgi:hypothetical protein
VDAARAEIRITRIRKILLKESWRYFSSSLTDVWNAEDDFSDLHKDAALKRLSE